MSNVLAGAILAASLGFAAVASAMQVPQYDRMPSNDQSSYDTLLVIGAKNALQAHGQPDQAQKIIELFKDSSTSGGSIQLIKNLEKIRLLNAKNAANPDNKEPAYQVEHAFYLTLKDNGITVPISILLAINKDFKPSQPGR